MSRAKSKAPEALAPNLEHMPPVEAAQLGKDMAELRMTLEAADALFGDGMAFEQGRVANQIRSQTKLMGDCGIQIGSYFNWAKVHIGHGGFGRFVRDDAGYSERSARVFMGLAHTFLQKNGQPIPLLQYLRDQSTPLSQAKLIELTTLNADQLAKLGDGEEVFGIDRDDLALMTAKEVREAFAAKDIENQSVRERNEKLVAENETLDKENRRMRRGGVEFEQHAYVGLLNEITADANVGFASVVAGLARLKDCGEKLAQAAVPAHLEDIAKRAHVMTLNTSTLQLAESIARVIWEQEALLGKFLNDAPHRLAELDGHGTAG